MKIKGVDNIMATKFDAVFSYIANDGTLVTTETSFIGNLYFTSGQTGRFSPEEYSIQASGICLPTEKGCFAKSFIGEKVSQGLVPEKVIFNDPATIVYWKDGTKTVVKAYDEYFDKEKGLAMAYMKKIHGNKGNYNDVFRKWIEDEV